MKIVVLTTPPAGYTAGEEIVGIVTGELTAYGKAAAEMLGESLGGQGQVGWIFHDADFWFTNQRDQAFKDWLAYLYPDIEVVDEAGFTDPARTEDIASAMITRNPELTGIYVAWATAADGVLAALRAAGRRRCQGRHQRPRPEPRHSTWSREATSSASSPTRPSTPGGAWASWRRTECSARKPRRWRSQHPSQPPATT